MCPHIECDHREYVPKGKLLILVVPDVLTQQDGQPVMVRAQLPPPDPPHPLLQPVISELKGCLIKLTNMGRRSALNGMKGTLLGVDALTGKIKTHIDDVGAVDVDAENIDTSDAQVQHEAFDPAAAAAAQVPKVHRPCLSHN